MSRSLPRERHQLELKDLRLREIVSLVRNLSTKLSGDLGFAQKLIIMRRSSELVLNRLRQQAGNLNEKTRSLTQPVPYRVRLIEFLGKASKVVAASMTSSPAQASRQFWREPALAISFEEFTQTLMLERANHV